MFQGPKISNIGQSWVKLAESSEKSSICTDNNQDLEDISKIQVDKINSGFPFTKQNIYNKISNEYLIPNKFLTTLFNHQKHKLS